MVAVVGRGGEGKSRLIGEWWTRNRDRLAERGQGVFWCTPYDARYTFATFLDDALRWLLGESYDPREHPDGVASLLRGLSAHRCLIVLDGAERWLRRWSDDTTAEIGDLVGDADRRPIDDGFAKLLDALPSHSGESQLLITTRATPCTRQTRSLPFALIGRGDGRDRSLSGLRNDAALGVLRNGGVTGGDEELVKLAEEFGRHALVLEALGAFIGEVYLGDIAAWRAESPAVVTDDDRVPHLNDRIWEHHAEDHDLLRAVAIAIPGTKVEGIAAAVEGDTPAVRRRLAALARWALVDLTLDGVDMHALHRTDIRARVDEDQRRVIVERLVAYHSSRPITENSQKIEQIQPLLDAVDQAIAAEYTSLSLTLLRGGPVGSLVEWSLHRGYLGQSIDRCTSIEHLLGEAEEQRHALAGLLADRGVVLEARGDLAAALADSDRAIELYRELVEGEGRGELRNDLAKSHNNRGNAHQARGVLAAALADYDRAIELYRELVEGEGRGELRNDLASSHNNRGNAHQARGDLAAALGDFDRAIELYRELVEGEGRGELRNDLAGSHNNRGNAHRARGDQAAALGDFDRAIELYRELVEGEGRGELRNDLAKSHNNRGLAHRARGDQAAALADYDRAIELRRELVEGEGRGELRNDLASSHNNRGNAHQARGDLAAALADYDRAIELYRELVEGEGRGELIGDLESAMFNNALALSDAGRNEEAAAAMDEGGDLLSDAVRQGRLDQLLSLAQTAGTRITKFDSWGPSEAAIRWLSVITDALRHEEAQTQVGNPYWRERLGPLTAVVTRNAEALVELGADLDAFLQVTMPYVFDEEQLAELERAAEEPDDA